MLFTRNFIFHRYMTTNVIVSVMRKIVSTRKVSLSVGRSCKDVHISARGFAIMDQLLW